MKNGSKISLVIFSMCLLISCSSPEEFNARAKYEGKEYISLKKLYEINTGIEIFADTFLQAVYDIDVDDKNYLYVVDRKESKIRKFDEAGNYVESFGGEGQGPQELESAFYITIFDNKMFITEWYKLGMKIWDMEGRYVGYERTSQILNSQFIRPFKDHYIGVSHKYDKGGQKLEVVKVSRDSLRSEILMSGNYDFNKYWRYSPIFKHAFISETEFYGTPQIADEYLIHKYDITGNILKTITRPYVRKPYSPDVKEFLTKRYEQNPGVTNKWDYPPIVREIFLDNKENLWVAVGEHVKDVNWRIPIPTSIDIFNKEGVYLYSFESSEIGRIAFIKNGRLYSVTGPRGSGDEFDVIHVFDVIYNY